MGPQKPVGLGKKRPAAEEPQEALHDAPTLLFETQNDPSEMEELEAMYATLKLGDDSETDVANALPTLRAIIHLCDGMFRNSQEQLHDDGKPGQEQSAEVSTKLEPKFFIIYADALFLLGESQAGNSHQVFLDHIMASDEFLEIALELFPQAQSKFLCYQLRNMIYLYIVKSEANIQEGKVASDQWKSFCDSPLWDKVAVLDSPDMVDALKSLADCIDGQDIDDLGIDSQAFIQVVDKLANFEPYTRKQTDLSLQYAIREAHVSILLRLLSLCIDELVARGEFDKSENDNNDNNCDSGDDGNDDNEDGDSDTDHNDDKLRENSANCRNKHDKDDNTNAQENDYKHAAGTEGNTREPLLLSEGALLDKCAKLLDDLSHLLKENTELNANKDIGEPTTIILNNQQTQYYLLSGAYYNILGDEEMENKLYQTAVKVYADLIQKYGERVAVPKEILFLDDDNILNQSLSTK